MNKIFANAGTDLDLATDVVSAIDTLINERAYESGLGRWEYIQSLTEIDSSHWNKILNGKAGLSDAKFRLLCKILSRSKEETARLIELFNEYRKERRKNPTAPILKHSKATRQEKLEELAAANGLRLSDLNDSEAFHALLNNAISRERIRGNASKADANGQLLITAVNTGMIKLNEASADADTTALLSVTAYSAYQSGNKQSYKYVLENIIAPELSHGGPSMTEAARFHLLRRYQEEFLGAPPVQLVDIQNTALQITQAFDNAPSSTLPLSVMIELNKVRLNVEMGVTLASDLHAMNVHVNRVDTRGALEHRILFRVGIAQWHMKNGDIAQAHFILEHCMRELDRKLGQMDWARCKVREMQAKVAEREFFLGGQSMDDAETVDGFFTDSIHCAQRCGNEILVRKLKESRQSFRDRSGHF
ncbi:hypothetical protein [Roseibium suaedae]|uniref:hypothetical protein n=1 Tax=Roseibium suaedae TaxID=735517 RepID=UPI001114BEF5|nr:hypothetical protein [Roseibium suaedae]